jgi:hypothetical protein
MNSRVQSEGPTDRVQRLLAAGCSALALLLALAAFSPALHAIFHATGEARASEIDDCAVVLFSGGTSCPVTDITVARSATALCADRLPGRCELLLVPPRYLRQPERGPPLAGLS